MIKKDLQIIVRMSKNQKLHLQRQSLIAGCSIAEFIRQLVAGTKIEPVPAVGSAELIFAIDKIGNNINQIAKKVNMGNPVTEKLLNEVLDLQIEVMRQVKTIGNNQNSTQALQHSEDD